MAGIELGGGGSTVLFLRGLRLSLLRRLSGLTDVSESAVDGLKLDVDLDFASLEAFLPVSLESDFACVLVVVVGSGR